MSLTPNNIILERIPKSIAMLHLNDDEIDDLRDVSLADAILEVRRRIKAKSDPIRAEINAYYYDEQISSLNASSSQPHLAHNPEQHLTKHRPPMHPATPRHGFQRNKLMKKGICVAD